MKQLGLPGIEQLDIIQRIDAAIDRLSTHEPTSTIQQSIANLEEKRCWVLKGQYQIRQVNEKAVALVGREICQIVKYRRYGREQ